MVGLTGNNDTATPMSGNARNCIISSEEELNGLMCMFEKSLRAAVIPTVPIGSEPNFTTPIPPNEVVDIICNVR